MKYKIEKINKARSQFFEKIKEVDKPLAIWLKKNEKKTTKKKETEMKVGTLQLMLKK